MVWFTFESILKISVTLWRCEARDVFLSYSSELIHELPSAEEGMWSLP